MLAERRGRQTGYGSTVTTSDDELETTWSADAATSTGDTHAGDTADADAEDADAGDSDADADAGDSDGRGSGDND